MEGKDFLNYFGFWSFRFFEASQILSSTKYLDILKLARKHRLVNKCKHIYIGLSFGLILTLSFSMEISWIPIYIYIYIYMCVCVSSSSYRTDSMDFSDTLSPSILIIHCPPAVLPNYILYPHRADVNRFLLVSQHWLIHVLGSIEEHHSWVFPCFSSSVLHVLFVLLGWFLWWEVSHCRSWYFEESCFCGLFKIACSILL